MQTTLAYRAARRLYREFKGRFMSGPTYASQSHELSDQQVAVPNLPAFAHAIAPAAELIWIDVGAHLGERTFGAALHNPKLRVYAFEPNLKIAIQRMGLLPNYVVLPMAVAETDGVGTFHLNSFAAASSLLPFNDQGLKKWIGGDQLKVEKSFPVPTIRLDTFLTVAGIAKVDFLKIDAQGADYAVIRSLGKRIKDVQELTLEVQITDPPLYEGGSIPQDVKAFLEKQNFTLQSMDRQSFDQEENYTFRRKD